MKSDYKDAIDKRRNADKELKSTIGFLAVLITVFVIIAVVFTQMLNGVVVVGNSMNDTLKNGDYLYMQINYTTLERGDIIVLDSNEKLSNGDCKYLIKRLIALPGDSIYAVDGKLYRKNKGDTEFKLVDEDYLFEPWTQNNVIATADNPLVLKDDEIFFMGDNRNNSEDSRGHYKTLKSSDVVGVVTPWSISCKGFLTFIFNIF